MESDIITCSYFYCKNKTNKNDTYDTSAILPVWQKNDYFCSEKCFDSEYRFFRRCRCSFCDKNLLFAHEKPVYHSYESLDMYFCDEKCKNAFPEVKCDVCNRKRYYWDCNKFYRLDFVEGDNCDIGKNICKMCYDNHRQKFICNVCNEYVFISNGLIIKDKKNVCNNCAKKS